MRRTTGPSRRPAQLTPVLLAAALLALAGCSSNTPTAGVTVTVTAAAPTSGSSSPTTASSIAPLPAELDGLRTVDAAATAKGGDRAKSFLELNTHRKQLTEKAYSDAYGMPVVVEFYANDDLTFLPTVIAVGAQSPGLTIGPVSDPADLGLAVNMKTVAQDGQVQCVVNAVQAVPSGQQADPEKSDTSECQRTGPALTVLVFGTGDGTAGHKQMVDLADAAWTAAGGS